MIDELREELYLYNLLRQLFLKEPSKELINATAKIDPPDETDDEINYGLKLLIESARKNEYRLNAWLEELALEYARLFIGPQNPPAVPYASFYLSESHSLMTDETIDVRKQYLEAGMAVKELYSIPDDHIGIELEFIYYLTQKTIELFEQEQREKAARLFEMRSDFLTKHMAQWVPLFVERILNSTHEDFYKGAAIMLKGCV
ncbi:MAG: molecular chaperone TorD family protein [Nitrospirae bacterium]|nr:molecular chaperone TorD family protein [Nitrospirota bacterium]